MKILVELDELDYCVYDGCRLPACTDGAIDAVDDDCVFVERVCVRHGWRLIVGRVVARLRRRLNNLVSRFPFTKG